MWLRRKPSTAGLSVVCMAVTKTALQHFRFAASFRSKQDSHLISWNDSAQKKSAPCFDSMDFSFLHCFRLVASANAT